VTWQVNEDQVAMGREQVDNRIPGLPAMPDSVQKQQRFTGPMPLTGQALLHQLSQSAYDIITFTFPYHT
jgi:hypothetical protein